MAAILFRFLVFSTSGEANDGDGFFTEELNHQLPNAMYSCIGVVDIDLDNDNDLVLLSEEDGYQRQAFLFLNNGSGAFEESIELPVSIPELAHFEFGDIDTFCIEVGLSKANSVTLDNITAS